MKNIKYLVVVLFLASCSGDVTLSKREYEKLKGKKVVTIGVSEYELITASDGHDYLDNGGCSSYSCMHYVECKKCAK